MKKAVRTFARALFTRIRIRGRHRFADIVGPRLAPAGIELIDLNGIAFPVDHTLAPYRHVYYGIYEEENVRLLKSLVRPGDICIDAGANIGYLTSVLAGSVGRTGRVYAFEPSRSCLDTLAFLDLVENVEVLPDAIGAHGGTATFVDTERAVTMGYAFLAELRGDPGDGTRYDVRVRTVDEFCAERGQLHLRLLKLDIEGAELSALQGAAGMLEGRAIDYLLIEASFGEHAEERHRDAGIAELLGNAGYSAIATHGRDVFWSSPRAN
jgi:FkbM family methyltransferase